MMQNRFFNTRPATVVALLLILLIAAYLRVGAVTHTVVDHPIRADASQYFAYAYNLRYKGVYSDSRPAPNSKPHPDAFRSPGYPLFLAAFMGNVSINSFLLSVTLVQALLGLGTVLLTFALFRHVLPEAWALVGALLVALSPHLISMETYIISESLYTFLCVLAMWLVARVVVTDSPWIGGMAGAALAAAALTRPTLEYFIVPLLLVWSFSAGGEVRKKVLPAVLAGFVLVFSPWLIRNEITIGRLSNPRLAINTLQDGMYPNFMYKDIKASRGFPYRFDPRSREIGASMDSVLREIGSRFVREPSRELRWYLLGKPVTFFSWNILGGAGDVFQYPVKASPYFDRVVFRATYALMWWLRWPLVALCLIACVLAWRRPFGDDSATRKARLIRRLLATLVLYYLILHVVGAPYPRYNIPLLPYIFGLAVTAVLAGVRALTRAHDRPGSEPSPG